MSGLIKTALILFISLVALVLLLTIFEVISFQEAKENILNIVFATIVVLAVGLLVHALITKKDER